MEINLKIDDLPWDDESDFEYNIAKLTANVLADKVRETVLNNIKKAIEKTIMAEVQLQVRAIIENKIDTPIRKTNSYGEPTSGVTTLNELIVSEATLALNRKVTSSGSYTDKYDARLTLRDYLVQIHVKEAMEEIIKDVVADGKQAVKDNLAKSISDAVASVVK